MRYFTTDTHFGHPLVTVLRGFTTFDPSRSTYEEILHTYGRKAAEDWAKKTGAIAVFVGGCLPVRR